jgi:tripartite-type tricarboxylate transporter receptor subunit TctC
LVEYVMRERPVIQGEIRMLRKFLGTVVSVLLLAPLSSAIAVTSPARVSWLPELPTIAEEGLPGYDVSVWFGVFAPAGTPEKIVERLANEFISATSDPGVKDKLFAQGFILRTLKPAEFGAFVRNEIDRWEKVVRASGAKAE